MKTRITLTIFLLLTFTNQVSAGMPPVYGKQGVVVAQTREATDAGLAMLKAGGNAVDAAVAVSYALAVTHPTAGNIGGGGFMLIRFADGRTTAIDYREKAPGAAGRDLFLNDSGAVVEGLSTTGGLAVGVPGTVAGLQLALDRYGTLSRKQVMKPAIQLAQKGFPISFNLAYSLSWLNEEANSFPETRRVFCRNGVLYDPGDVFVQPDLARTLKLISKLGNPGFYTGTVADALVASVQKHGGIISREDLAAYEAVEREPVQGDYRGYGIISMCPPSSGGIALISMLNMLEGVDFDSVGWHSAEHVQVVVEAERRAYADRSRWIGDSDFFDVPVTSMLSEEYAQMRFQDFVPGSATPSYSVAPFDQATMAGVQKESEETTHFSVVDQWGNAVSVTTTLNWSFGSYVTAADAGFLLNNEMDDFSSKPGAPNSFGLLGSEANAIEPGKRMLSSMTPTIVTHEGELFMIVGTPGGATIITSVMQVIQNVVDFGMPPVDAVYAPRFHHQWVPDLVYYGPRALGTETRESLTGMGYTLQARYYLGEVNAIMRDQRFGGWIGVPDYRHASSGSAY